MLSETGGPARSGDARMVDVGGKEVTVREAVAAGEVVLSKRALKAVVDGTCPKGDVIAVAKVAAIQAAKRTSEIVPLCHPIPLDSFDVEITPGDGTLDIVCTARASARTGVEMEALTGVAAAALAVYDMTKGLCREGRIERVRLERKSGGKSGDFHRGEGVDLQE